MDNKLLMRFLHDPIRNTPTTAAATRPHTPADPPGRTERYAAISSAATHLEHNFASTGKSIVG
jgi:hypothetical protein